MTVCQSLRATTDKKHLPFFKHDGQVALDAWICVCLCVQEHLCSVYLNLEIHFMIHRNSCLPFPIRPASTELIWKTWESAKTTRTSQNYSRQRCHRYTDYATRLKKQAVGWLFSEQTNRTLGCLLKWRRTMGGRTGMVLEAFLCLCWGTPEDQGNEIGQWKDCFDRLCLKPCCCYPWLFLGMETEFESGRHADTDMEANRFPEKVKSNTKSKKDLNIYFLLKKNWKMEPNPISNHHRNNSSQLRTEIQDFTINLQANETRN